MIKIEVLGEIINVQDEAPDVKTFYIKVERRISFIPGQYCLISIVGSKEFAGEKRPFTFANSPTEDIIRLTVKRMGSFTTALHSLKIKSKLIIEGPFGEMLNFDESVKQDVVFIAGGSGITPFISAIRYAIEKKMQNKICLFFSNRAEKDIIYKTELENIKNKNIKIINTLSDNAPDGWKGEKGRIDKAMIEKHVKNLQERVWYLCGPPPMINAMKGMLIGAGVSESKLRVEPWQIPGKPP